MFKIVDDRRDEVDPDWYSDVNRSSFADIFKALQEIRQIHQGNYRIEVDDDFKVAS